MANEVNWLLCFIRMKLVVGAMGVVFGIEVPRGMGTLVGDDVPATGNPIDPVVRVSGEHFQYSVISICVCCLLLLLVWLPHRWLRCWCLAFERLE